MSCKPECFLGQERASPGVSNTHISPYGPDPRFAAPTGGSDTNIFQFGRPPSASAPASFAVSDPAQPQRQGGIEQRRATRGNRGRPSPYQNVDAPMPDRGSPRTRPGSATAEARNLPNMQTRNRQTGAPLQEQVLSNQPHEQGQSISLYQPQPIRPQIFHFKHPFDQEQELADQIGRLPYDRSRTPGSADQLRNAIPQRPEIPSPFGQKMNVNPTPDRPQVRFHTYGGRKSDLPDLSWIPQNSSLGPTSNTGFFFGLTHQFDRPPSGGRMRHIYGESPEPTDMDVGEDSHMMSGAFAHPAPAPPHQASTIWDPDVTMTSADWVDPVQKRKRSNSSRTNSVAWPSSHSQSNVGSQRTSPLRLGSVEIELGAQHMHARSQTIRPGPQERQPGSQGRRLSSQQLRPQSQGTYLDPRDLASAPPTSSRPPRKKGRK